MLTCPKCSFENELGRIFCHQCGTKLDLNSIKPPSRGGPKIRRRGGWTVGRVVRSTIELASTALLIWAIWLACSVPDAKFARPTNAELISADTKRLALEELISRNRAGTVEVSETELNAFLNSLSFEKPKGEGVEVAPLGLRADFRDGVVQVAFLGDMHLGSAVRKKLYVSLTGVPVVEDGSFDFRPVAAAIGKLPIHPRLLDATDLVQSYFRRLFGTLGNEKNLLDKLTSISIKPHRALLAKQLNAPDQPSPTPASH